MRRDQNESINKYYIEYAHSVWHILDKGRCVSAVEVVCNVVEVLAFYSYITFDIQFYLRRSIIKEGTMLSNFYQNDNG